MVVTLGQQYHVGEKPTVILHIYIINRHPETRSKTKKKYKMNLDYSSTCYIGSRIGRMDVRHCFCYHIYYTSSKLQIHKAGKNILLSDNDQVNLTTRC